MLGRSIIHETYEETRELGEAGLVEPKPVVRGPDIDENGSVWWVSHEREALIANALLPEMLEMLDSDQSYKLFTVIDKAPAEPLALVSEAERRSENKIGGALFKRGDKITLGAMEGIDSGIWERGREYLVYVRYKLRPLPVQNADPGRFLRPTKMLTSQTVSSKTLPL